MRKNILAIAAIIIATCALALVSCGKDNVKNDSHSISKHTYSQCANPMNPFDEAGYLHNYYLNLMGEDGIFVKDSNEPLTSKEINSWIFEHADYLKRYNIDIEDFADKYGELYNSLGNLYWGFIDSLKISSESKAIVKKIISGAIDIYLEKGTWDYELYYEYISSEEKKIIDNPFYLPEYNHDELRSVLSFTSVLRHSLFYWTNNVNVKKDSGKGPGTWGIIAADALFGLVSWNLGVAALASGIATLGAVANDDVKIEKNGDTYTLSPTEGDGNNNGNGNSNGNEGGGNGNDGNGND